MALQPSLEEILTQAESLPEMPHVALQVNHLLNDPNSGASELSRVIMMDPALTSKVLKLCNSAQYGLSRKIATISEAVAILGHLELKQIIFTIISHSILNRPVEGYALEKGALWENAATCAVFAKHLAQKVGFKNSELAFIAALLKDIGKVALESYLRGKGELIEGVAKTQKMSFADAEAEILGLNHTEVGAKLAMKWNLPQALVNTIAFHHYPSQLPQDISAEDRQLISIVHLADIFTMMTGNGVGLDGLMYPLDMYVFAALNLPQDSPALENLYAELLSLQGEVSSTSSALDSGERG